MMASALVKAFMILLSARSSADVRRWLLLGAVGGALPALAEPPSLVVRAQKLYRLDGSEPAAGSVLVKDGRIAAVGTAVEADESVPVLEVPVLMPGLVDAYARIAVEGADAEQTLEVATGFDLAPGIDLHSRQFTEAADEGITTLHVMPGTDSVFAGQSVVIDSFSPHGRAIIRKPSAFPVVALCRDPTRGNRARSRPDSIYVRQPTNRMGVVWIIRQQLQALGAQADDAAGWTWASVLRGETPLLFVSRTEVDIASVVTLAEEFQFSPIILDANEAYRVMDVLAGTGIPVVVRELPTQAQEPSLMGQEQTALRWNQLGRLHQREIPFAIGGGNLLDKARFAVRFGLPRDVALASITLAPARILRIDDEVGSISPGRRANMLALSGDPLSPGSQIIHRWIDGETMVCTVHDHATAGQPALSP